MTSEQERREQTAHGFATFYEQTYPDVLRFVRRRAGPENAEDVTHEAFLVVWRRYDELPRRPGDARAWVFGIARNALLNARRGQTRRDALGVRIADLGDSGSFGGPAINGEEDLVASRLDLAAAWQLLGAADQEVLALSIFDDLTSPEAGRVLGISSAAYRIRLYRARLALRGHLDIQPAPGRAALSPQTENTP